MKASVYHAPGGPGVLRYEDVPDPVTGEAEILVRIEAISLEGGDRGHRAGDPSLAAPAGVGYQCAGTVVAVGGGVTRFHEGDRVVTIGESGSHAELRAVAERTAWRIPAGLSTDRAACVPIPFGTADDSLFEYGRLAAGETVLIHAGAGGVGLAAIQLAGRAGARVIVTASGEGRLARLADFGAARGIAIEGIDHVTSDFVTEVRRLTGGHGADVVLNTLGSVTLRGSLAALAIGGRCVTIRDFAGLTAQGVDAAALKARGQVLVAYYLGAEMARGPRLYRLVGRHLADVAEGRLDVIIDRTFPLSEAAAAHAYVEERRAFGRVLLVP